jgi:hypothetical protein
MTRARKLRLITHNPCIDVGKLNERWERRQAKPLTYEEEARVKQASPPWLSTLITVAETGLRVRKEALPLKWEDVDLDSELAAFSSVILRQPLEFGQSGSPNIAEIRWSSGGNSWDPFRHTYSRVHEYRRRTCPITREHGEEPLGMQASQTEEFTILALRSRRGPMPAEHQV